MLNAFDFMSGDLIENSVELINFRWKSIWFHTYDFENEKREEGNEKDTIKIDLIWIL